MKHRILCAIECKTCGWRIEKSRRIERAKGQHLQICPNAVFEVTIFPFGPASTANQSKAISLYSARGVWVEQASSGQVQNQSEEESAASG